MVKLSQENIQKIKEMILNEIYHNSPKALYTAEIARLIIRDEEFTKKLLLELKQSSLIEEIKKSPEGNLLLKRSRWKLTNETFKAYQKLV